MLGMGLGEMILIAGIALVVIGPEKFPDFAKIVVRTIRDLRGYVEDAKQDITKELRPVRDEVKSLSKYRPEEYIDALSGKKPSESGPAKNPEDEKVFDAGAQPYGMSDADDFTYNPEPDESSFKTAGNEEVPEPEANADAAPEPEGPVPYASGAYEMDRKEKQEQVYEDQPNSFDSNEREEGN